MTQRETIFRKLTIRQQPTMTGKNWSSGGGRADDKGRVHWLKNGFAARPRPIGLWRFRTPTPSLVSDRVCHHAAGARKDINRQGDDS
jgi:hypothetical protein